MDVRPCCVAFAFHYVDSRPELFNKEPEVLPYIRACLAAARGPTFTRQPHIDDGLVVGVNFHGGGTTPKDHDDRKKLCVERRRELMGVRPIHTVQHKPLCVAYDNRPSSTIVVPTPVPSKGAVGKNVSREQLALVSIAYEPK